jgi:hypothetical protein
MTNGPLIGRRHRDKLTSHDDIEGCGAVRSSFEVIDVLQW